MKYGSLILVAAMLGGCESRSERAVAPPASEVASSLKMQGGDGFRLATPMGIVMTRTDPVEDFSLYDVSQEDGTKLLTIYAGTAPSPMAPPEATWTETRSGVRCTRWGDGASHECVFSGSPMRLQVHAFYTDLPRERREIADQIVASIRLTE